MEVVTKSILLTVCILLIIFFENTFTMNLTVVKFVCISIAKFCKQFNRLLSSLGEIIFFLALSTRKMCKMQHSAFAAFLEMKSFSSVMIQLR